MKFLFLRHVRRSIKVVFLAMPWALCIAAAIWFFGGFIAGLDIVFFGMFRLAYVFIVLADLALEVISFFLGWRQLYRVMKEFDISKKDAAEGLFKYEILKKAPVAVRTKRDFMMYLSIGRAFSK